MKRALLVLASSIVLSCGGGEERPAAAPEPAASEEVEPAEEGDLGADESEAFCEPLAVCGCWMGCARVVATGDTFRVVDGVHAGQVMRREPDCSTISGNETCRRVCDADGPDADCRDGLVPEAETCTEACPPTEARYHCETAGDGCFRVAHPRRSAPSE